MSAVPNEEKKLAMGTPAKGDLLLNKLLYKEPTKLSLAINRTMNRQYFQRSTYSASDTAIIDWNTGSTYVNAANSYLVFDLACTGATTPTANFASGSAVNIIRNITIRSRSGTELDRIERVNLWSKNQLAWENGEDWYKKFGTLMGIGLNRSSGDAANVSETATRFVVPLSALSGFFKPTGGQLIPPQLASGLHIELTLADYREALFQKTGTVTGYTVSNISIQTECVTLSDDTQKSLNDMSSKTGLEYTYPRYHTSSQTITSTAITAQIRKAVGIASMASAYLLTQGDILDETKDSLRSIGWNVSQWQYRVGSLYFPNQPIVDETTPAGKESLMVAQVAYDKPRHPHSENSISVTDFQSYFGGMIVSIEKDAALNLSGLPINNSRTLELQATLASWTENLELVIYLEYTSVAKAWVDNCSVSV